MEQQKPPQNDDEQLLTGAAPLTGAAAGAAAGGLAAGMASGGIAAPAGALVGAVLGAAAGATIGASARTCLRVFRCHSALTLLACWLNRLGCGRADGRGARAGAGRRRRQRWRRGQRPAAAGRAGGAGVRLMTATCKAVACGLHLCVTHETSVPLRNACARCPLPTKTAAGRCWLWPHTTPADHRAQAPPALQHSGVAPRARRNLLRC